MIVALSYIPDSWVDVQGSSGENSPKRGVQDPQTSTLYMPLNIEKLLNDAQKESTNNSRESSARQRWAMEKNLVLIIKSLISN